MYVCVRMCVCAPPSLLWHSQPFSGPVWLAVGMVAMTTTYTSPCRTNNGRHRWEQVDHVNTYTHTHTHTVQTYVVGVHMTMATAGYIPQLLVCRLAVTYFYVQNSKIKLPCQSNGLFFKSRIDT